MPARTAALLSLVSCLLLLPACDSNDHGPSSSEVIKAGLKKIKREMQPGAALVRKKCAPCHYLDRNLPKVGPSLKGIYGRKPTISGVPFEVWDEAALDAWIMDPTAIKSNTMMAIPGIKSAKDRKEIIRYLKQL